jgi:rhodanese-related sulfurtransferase
LNTPDEPTLFITSLELLARLLDDRAPLVIDVRKPHAFDPSRMVPGSVRRLHERPLDALDHIAQDRTLVYVCVHGHEVSQNAVHAAREAGWNAFALKGGIIHWINEGHPVVCQLNDVSKDSPETSARSVGSGEVA